MTNPQNKLPKGQGSCNYLMNRYRQDAKRRNIHFNLSKREFQILTSSDCFYCNSEPSLIVKGHRSNGEYVYNGIDREDSNFGYEYWNCVSCCKTCNYAKNNLSQEEFYDWVEKLLDYTQKTGYNGFR